MIRSIRTAASAAALGTVLAIGLVADGAQAKGRARDALYPVPSDSSYAALLARPADSLTTAELSWLAVQGQWRAQRAAVSAPSVGISEGWYPEPGPPSHSHFSDLASQPFAALADSDRAWLVAANAAQLANAPAHKDSDASTVVGVVLVGVLVGTLVGIFTLGYAISHTVWWR